MQGDIAKYAMWLFHHTDAPHDQLPALYDHLCLKNPVRSTDFSFHDFEALFKQWHWQQGASCDSQTVSIGFEDDSVCPGKIVADTVEPEVQKSAAQMLSAETAPIADYHVITEMLIERLVAKVKDYLSEGWVPLGGVCRTNSSSSASYWAQALVKHQLN